MDSKSSKPLMRDETMLNEGGSKLDMNEFDRAISYLDDILEDTRMKREKIQKTAPDTDGVQLCLCKGELNDGVFQALLQRVSRLEERHTLLRENTEAKIEELEERNYILLDRVAKSEEKNRKLKQSLAGSITGLKSTGGEVCAKADTGGVKISKFILSVLKKGSHSETELKAVHKNLVEYFKQAGKQEILMNVEPGYLKAADYRRKMIKLVQDHPLAYVNLAEFGAEFLKENDEAELEDEFANLSD